MSDKDKTLTIGERYDTMRLYEMGLIPSEMVVDAFDIPRAKIEVVEIDHENSSITFDISTADA